MSSSLIFSSNLHINERNFDLSNTIELWKPVSGLDNYEVSNYGRVRNVNTGRILKGSQNNHGYWRYDLSIDGKRVVKSGHRLVADAFIEPVEGKDFVNHKDGCKTNNFFENLEWCTNEENMRHAFSVLGREPHNKTPVKCIETGVVYESACEAERATGISNSEINRCCRGKRPSAHGLHFEYEIRK